MHQPFARAGRTASPVGALFWTPLTRFFRGPASQDERTQTAISNSTTLFGSRTVVSISPRSHQVEDPDISQESRNGAQLLIWCRSSRAVIRPPLLRSRHRNPYLQNRRPKPAENGAGPLDTRRPLCQPARRVTRHRVKSEGMDLDCESNS